MATVQSARTGDAVQEPLEQKFQRLADTWDEAVAHQSSSSKREGHPCYQEIIALGPAVVPLLLRDLERTGRHWFAALATITRANPVPAEDAGKTSKVVQDWLVWGRSRATSRRTMDEQAGRIG